MQVQIERCRGRPSLTRPDALRSRAAGASWPHQIRGRGGESPHDQPAGPRPCHRSRSIFSRQRPGGHPAAACESVGSPGRRLGPQAGCGPHSGLRCGGAGQRERAPKFGAAAPITGRQGGTRSAVSGVVPTDCARFLQVSEHRHTALSSFESDESRVFARTSTGEPGALPGPCAVRTPGPLLHAFS